VKEREPKYPEDLTARKHIRTLAKRHLRITKEQVIFLDSDYHEIKTVAKAEIVRGGHLKVRDELLSQANLRVIAHVGLARRGKPTIYVHVVEAGATEDVDPYQVYALHDTKHVLQWVRPTDAAIRAWKRRWSPDQ